MDPTGHGLGARLRQHRIVYRDLSEAEVQITRYGRLEAAGIHTPTGARRYKVRWPAGWTKLDDEDRIAGIASRRLRGPWSKRQPALGRPPRIVFNDKVLEERNALGAYDPAQHTVVLPSLDWLQQHRPGLRKLSRQQLKLWRRSIFLHELGHASEADRQYYSEPINEGIAQAILLALHPAEVAKFKRDKDHFAWTGYAGAIRWLFSLLPRKRIVELIEGGVQRVFWWEVDDALAELAKRAGASKEELEAVRVHLHRGFRGEGARRARQTLRKMARRAGIRRLTDEEARGIIVDAAGALRRRLRLQK